MPRIFDHIDLRVRSLNEAAPFYCGFLPLLGFTQHVEIEGWLQFERAGDAASEFFGVTEDAAHVANRNRVAFWAESNTRVDQIAARLESLGAQMIEGPDFEAEYYYAVYFNDPSGNAIEVCHRTRGFSAPA